MASSSSSVPDWKYDVFLNFRGEDTRRTFIGHLYKALVQNSINTFIDAEELRKGNGLSQLLTAISDSRLSVVVFSQNYASSTWCLKELVQILQCMDQKKQIVIPIFYEVDPSHVRKIKGSFEEAFSKHEDDPNADMEEVQRWRSALQRAPDLCGWDSQNYQDDAKLVELIVDDIFKKLINILSSEKNGLVGMDSRLKKMDSLLCPEVDNIGFVGIWGMGGIGKTTIARAVYDKINHHFEGRCFLENVKQRFPSTDAGEAPLDMQAEILSSITNMKVGSSEILKNGFQKMIERVGRKKVLLVLDNVESSSQIEALIGNQPSFGGGSRIIITTRDKQSLSRIGDQIYEPELLNDNDAVELFMQYAFSTKQPTEEYIDLSGHFIKYAQGLPLALKVLGAFLDNKSVLVWKDELKKIARNPHLGIQKVLRTSFDGLDGLQKEIFLDIACFFKQMKKDSAIRIMEGCDLHPHTGLDVLVGRALVTISSDDVLEMHDLLEELGHEIVRQESIKEPGGRSRLWSYEDVHHVLTKKTATEAVESIIVHWPHSDNVVELDIAFFKMTKLRLLRVHSHNIQPLTMLDTRWKYRDLKFLFEKLSYLFWHKCPLKSLSFNFNPENLVDIDMQYSWVKHLWKGTKPLGKLKIINLKGSHRLKKTPDFAEAKNLEKLILGGCTSLYEVHPSISALEKLVLFDLSWCGKLKSFSRNICMKSLETFDLSFCSKLEKFPEISEVMEKLSKLYLQGTAIKELPRSINNLTGLVTLNLEYCRELEILPSSIVQLKSLQLLNLSGCPKLKALPENIGNMERLRELRLDETSVKGLAPSISSLQNLEILSLKQCKKLLRLPRSIHMRSLRTLNLSSCSKLYNFSKIPEVMNLLELNLDETAISELPSSVKNFTGLVTLSLKDCRRLKILPGSFHMRSLQALNVSGCSNLKNFPEFLKVTENLTELHLDWMLVAEVSPGRENLKFSGIAIEELPSIIYSLTGLATLTLRYNKDFESLTSSICQLKSLKYLSLSGCTELKVFPDILENMERLASLDLDSTSIRELPASIERLQGLVSLNMKNCKSLVYLPDSICNLLSLEWLTLNGCSKLSKLPEDLRYLKRLDIKETGLDGYRPEQQFINLGDMAQFRSTEPKLNVIVPNMENEAVADVEERQDIAESSYVEEMRRRVEEMRVEKMRRRRRVEEMRRRRRVEEMRVEERVEEMRVEERVEEVEEMRRRVEERVEEMRRQVEEVGGRGGRDAGGRVGGRGGRDAAAGGRGGWKRWKSGWKRWKSGWKRCGGEWKR
ncbi:disease resistance protein RPV1-like isoform X1 [Pyrus x bretschneideri]|uniref:disease resistance protein RPV1-like isoform X1 n=2 Tax=Pyrus x bretschneideri TaxID=225117 RepID=UPI00202EA832|nr:disease resistance protein RPV1-like isoform X1 [Pyrus x bretschneideri]